MEKYSPLNHESASPKHNIKLPLWGDADQLKRPSKSRSEESFSDSSTDASIFTEKCGNSEVEVAELERLARLNASSEYEESESESDAVHDDNNGCNNASSRRNIDSDSDSSSECEEMDELARQLEFEVNALEEHNPEEQVLSNTADDGESSESLGSIDDQELMMCADHVEQEIERSSESIGDMDAPEIASHGSEMRLGDFVDAEAYELSENNQEDSYEQSLPDPEHCALSDEEYQESTDDGDDAETDLRQQLLDALAKSKANRVTRGDEQDRREMVAAGMALDLQFSSSVTSFFATEEEKSTWERLETSKTESKELARALFEATQLDDPQAAPWGTSKRGGLIWCYRKQLKEYIEIMQEHGEACIAKSSVKGERTWSRRNPGRGTKRKRFQHYKEFISLQVRMF